MKILLTGSIALDRIMVYPGKFSEVIQPDKLHVLSLSLLINELKETRGGVAANIAYTLALLGEKPVLLGSVGTAAKSYMKDLGKQGVDISRVHYSDLPTATFTVITDQANCQVGGFYPGAMSDSHSLRVSEFDPSEHFVVISPHDPQQMAKQVEECRASKMRLFYDVGQQASNISGKDIRAGIEAAELMIVNDYEMSQLVEKTGWDEDEIRNKVKIFIVTLGAKGCLIYQQGADEILSVPAMKVESVVDPTGAGDAFRAGFLYGYIRDFDIRTCAEFGTTAAAYAIEKHGTQAHFFTKKAFFERHDAKHISKETHV